MPTTAGRTRRIDLRLIRGVVFDCDGVLFDSRDVNRHYYNHILGALGLEPMSPEDLRLKEAAEREELRNQTVHMLLDFRMDYVEQHLKDLQMQMRQVANDMEQLRKLMAEYQDMQTIRNSIARQLGNNIIV